MMLVIAENLSVTVANAKVIDAGIKEDRYYEGNGQIVSWYVGHLI